MPRSLARTAWRGLRFAGILARSTAERVVDNHAMRADFAQRQARRMAECLGLTVSADGSPHSAQLIVANHLGYLDIVALATLLPACFVSKVEVAHWPAIGSLARKAGTLFLDRQRRGAVVDMGAQIQSRIAAGIPVVIFPEGTSSDGSSVLPFHSPLFELAVREGWRVAPAGIDYTLADGTSAAEVVPYWGSMTFGPHLLRLMSVSGIVATVRFGAVRTATGERKQFARQIHTAVAGLHATLKAGSRSPTGHGLAPASRPVPPGCATVPTVFDGTAI